MKKKQRNRILANTIVLDKLEFGDFRDHMELSESFKHESLTSVGTIEPKLRETILRLRRYNWLDCGFARMSVQANYCAYCSPRDTFEDLKEYDSMEIALFTKEKGYLTVEDLGIPNPFRTRIDDVGAFIPVQEIQYLFGRLCRKYKDRG